MANCQWLLNYIQIINSFWLPNLTALWVKYTDLGTGHKNMLCMSQCQLKNL